ncbi:MAG: efflux RND transporter periplasmic adaptor subunit [Desulfobulbaceae bacterium]|nr:efflux RND transporter periplasmic adaptor subunit [Desulfobulbaceae bacterium]
MTAPKTRTAWMAFALLIMFGGAIFFARSHLSDDNGRLVDRDERPIPVEVAEVREGPLALHRTFSGTIEPWARLTVAPKVSGRIQRLLVDVPDRVIRGRQVAQLEDDEFRHAVTEAQARRAVAKANSIEAESRLEIAQREMNRTTNLHERGIASDSVLDTARTEFLASQAAVQVAAANLEREDAALAAAEIRLGYTRISADWEQGDDDRTVAERYADEGDMVAANTPLFSIVEIDPVLAVIQVTEKDYPRIVIGQQADLQSDAFPGRIFTGTVTRIAPIFVKSTRQARIELNVPNPDHLLKPGMFTRCTLELERMDNAVSVPELAITRRQDQTGVFRVSEDGGSVQWIEVVPGIRDGIQVQLVGSDLSGRVVTLGQQFIEDGSAIHISGESPGTERGAGTP